MTQAFPEESLFYAKLLKNCEQLAFLKEEIDRFVLQRNKLIDQSQSLVSAYCAKFQVDPDNIVGRIVKKDDVYYQVERLDIKGTTIFVLEPVDVSIIGE